MIAYLRGQVVFRDPRYLIVESHGVGYKVFVAVKNMEKISQSAELFCHLQLKEKEADLYGFLSAEEMEFFQRLLKISGVGPKSALEISANTSLAELREADNPEALLMVNKKKAQAIILDIVGEVKEEKEDEALQALIQLGFNKKDAQSALKKIGPGSSSERVKKALQKLR